MSVNRHPTEPKTDPNTAPIEISFKQFASLLSSRQVLKKSITSKLDVHDVIVKGIPGAALKFMLAHAKVMNDSETAEPRTAELGSSPKFSPKRQRCLKAKQRSRRG